VGLLEARTDPTPRELRVFAILWVLFWSALGVLTLLRPQALGVAALGLGVAWAASLLFDAASRQRPMLGLLPPVILGGLSLLGRAGLRGVVLATLAPLAAAGGILIWRRPELGRRLYAGWMAAVSPAGWAVASLVLALIYYVVFTPIGLLLRAAGRDPLGRRSKGRAASYWVARSRRNDPASYFRQF
jgi:hypothetical protein